MNSKDKRTSFVEPLIVGWDNQLCGEYEKISADFYRMHIYLDLIC